MAENQNNDFYGGSASEIGSEFFSGGSAAYPIDPLGGSTGGFVTRYTNIAEITRDLERVEATLKRFNDPVEIKFIKESFKVVQQSQTLNYLDLIDFFHPLQNFSEFQKVSMIIGPRSSANLDPGSFYGTTGEDSMLIA